MSKSTPRERLIAVDALRGLALILMGLVHTAAFVYANIQAETYGGQPAVLQSWPYWVSALITTLAAPIFWLLSGTSVALLEASRRRSGETEWEITRFLIFRAILLIILDMTVADWAWAGGGPYTHILLSLAISLIILSVIRMLPITVLGVLVFLVMMAYQVALPWIAENLSQSQSLVMAFLLGYRTQPWPAVEFSLLGWGPLMGAGYLLGRIIDKPIFKKPSIWIFAGLIILSISVGLRFWGRFGDLVPYSPENPWYYFLVMSKTPPSLTYLSFKLGIASLLMAFLVRFSALLEKMPGRILVVCGQASLFFFVLHIVVYNGVSQVIMALNLPGPGIVRAYISWVIGLMILVPITYWYRGVRRSYPKSILRYL